MTLQESQQEVSMDAKGQWRDGKKMVDLGSNPDHSMSLGTFLPSLGLGLFIHKMGPVCQLYLDGWHFGKIVSQDSISNDRFNYCLPPSPSEGASLQLL